MFDIGMINQNYTVCGENVRQISKHLNCMDEKLEPNWNVLNVVA